MWDLDQIIRSNNQNALDAMMAGKQLQEMQSPLPEAWALTVLADKLVVGPPNLTALVDCLVSVSTVEGFLKLVRMLLPENELEIMSEPRTRRVYRFCYCFSKKYYPLPANTACGVQDWLTGIPVELMAISYSAYHEISMRSGFILLLSLVVYPYEGDDRDDEDDPVPFDPMNLPKENYRPAASHVAWLRNLVGNLAIGGQWIAPMGFLVVKVAENRIELVEAQGTPEVKETIRRTLVCAEKAGIEAAFSQKGRAAAEKLSAARIPLLDLAQNMVGAEMVNRIPQEGWYPAQLHQMTDNTPYDGVGNFADWACGETGCIILDSSYDDCGYMEGMGEPLFKWSQYNVNILAEQYPKVQAIRGKIDHIVNWLESDQINNFRELLEFMLKSEPAKVKPGAKHFYDPTERLIELEQVMEEDPEEEEEFDD